MVDLPRTPLDNYVTQGPQSSVSGGEIRSAFGELAAGMDALGNTFEDAAIEKAGLEGQGAVYTDEKGVLKYDARNPLSRAGKAFNRSARSAYLSQISMDARPAIANLEVEAKGNVGEFDKLSAAYLKEMLKGKDPLLRGVIQSELTGMITNSRTGMIRSQQQRDLQTQEKSIVARTTMANEDAAALARTGGTDTTEYAKQLDTIRTLEKERVSNPLFGYSQAESDVFLRGVEGDHMAASIVGQVEKIYNQPVAAGGGLKGATDFANKAFLDPSLQLSPAERARYKNAALGVLNQFKGELKVQRDEARYDAGILLKNMENKVANNEKDVFAVAGRLSDAGDGIGAMNLLRKNTVAKQLAAIPGMSDKEQAAALRTGTLGGGSGVDIFVNKIISAESGGDPNAKNPRSSALGYGQFLNKTWLRLMHANRPDITAGKSEEEILALRTDRVLAREMVGIFGRENAASLTASGFEPTAGNIYLSHFLGAGGAKTVLRADARTPISELFDADVIEANPFLASMNVADIRAWANRKMGGPNIEPEVYAALRTEFTGDTKKLWEKMKQGLMKGEPLSPDDLNQLGTNLALLGDKDMVDEAMGFLKQTGDYSTETLANMQKQKQEIEKGGVSAMEQDAHTIMTSVYENTVKELKNDPISMASKRGAIDPIEPLDMANPVNFASGLVDRQRAVSLTEQRYDIADVSALTADEVDFATKTLATAPIEQRVQMLSAMSEALSPQTYMATMAKIADKSGPVLGIAGGLYAKNPDVAESVLRGSELLKLTPGLVPSDGDKNKALIQASLPYQAFAPGMDAARAGFLEAARARYADLSSQTGDTSGEFAQPRMDQAVRDVTGGLVDFNGVSTFPPQHGMPQTEFDLMIAGLNERDVEGAQTSSGTMISADAIRDNGQLRAIGEGRYLVQLGNASRVPGGASLPYVSTANGQPFILDLTPRAQHMRDVNG